MIYERIGKLCVNLKYYPIEADLLLLATADATLAYHMNKGHWDTITFGGYVLS